MNVCFCLFACFFFIVATAANQNYDDPTSHALGWLKYKRQIIRNVDEGVKKIGNFVQILWKIVRQFLKILRVSIWPRNSTPRYILKRNENTCPHKKLVHE